jgi:SAM-dependent methyltransferase
MTFLIALIFLTIRIVDLGANYESVARYLAKTYEYHITCLNLSEIENERNRAMNREESLDKLMIVIKKSFENMSLSNSSFDLV